MDGIGKMQPKDYKTVYSPLILAKNTADARCDELVEVVLTDAKNGEKRRGRVLEVDSSRALVQVLDDGFAPDTEPRFLFRPLTVPVSRDMLGRVFNGNGEPIDGGTGLTPEKDIDINGLLVNQSLREPPSGFIQTGISAIDGLNPIACGQRLPVFSTSGLPHHRIAAQLARQAAVGSAKREDFAVVFAAIGITFEEASFFMEDFRRTGALSRAALYINLIDDPTIERVITPRVALTAAEFLAFECDKHVLVILTDLSNYCETMRGISDSGKEPNGRGGYPDYMYAELAVMYGRAGRMKGEKGSITQIPIFTMPGNDNPAPGLTGSTAEGQIILSRALHRKGIYPPVDVLASLSRLRDTGIGKGKTREGHAELMNQLFSAYAHGREALSVVHGKNALTAEDREFAVFADVFEDKYIRQGEYENRAFAEGTLELGWNLLATLPVKELKHLRGVNIDRYLKPRLTKTEGREY